MHILFTSFRFFVPAVVLFWSITLCDASRSPAWAQTVLGNQMNAFANAVNSRNRHALQNVFQMRSTNDAAFLHVFAAYQGYHFTVQSAIFEGMDTIEGAVRLEPMSGRGAAGAMVTLHNNARSPTGWTIVQLERR